MPRESAVPVVVNGRARTVEGGASVADLLREFDIEPTAVAVEVNGRIVPRAEYAGRTLVPGDRVELVTFVGGG